MRREPVLRDESGEAFEILAHCSRSFGSARAPSFVKTFGARDTISRPPDHKSAPSVRRTGSHAFWLRIVPKPPGDAPINATGLPPNTRGMSVAGRDSQSIAFLNTPGIELLYSGVTSSRPSAAAIASFNSATAGGMPADASRSPS